MICTSDLACPILPPLLILEEVYYLLHYLPVCDRGCAIQKLILVELALSSYSCCTSRCITLGTPQVNVL